MLYLYYIGNYFFLEKNMKTGTSDKVVILIKQATLLSDKVANPILEPYNLTLSQYKVIKFLCNNPLGNVRQIDIEQHFQLRNPTVTGIIKNLEKNGWVERVQNPDDARSKFLSPSKKTLELRKELNNLGSKVEKKLTKNLTKEEYKELVLLLKKILADAND